MITFLKCVNNNKKQTNSHIRWRFLALHSELTILWYITLYCNKTQYLSWNLKAAASWPQWDARSLQKSIFLQGVKNLSDYVQYKQFPPQMLRHIFSAASDDLIQLLESLLTLYPPGRCDCTQALLMPYFRWVKRSRSVWTPGYAYYLHTILSSKKKPIKCPPDLIKCLLQLTFYLVQ